MTKTKTKEVTHTRRDLTGWVELIINVGASVPAENVMLNEAEDGPFTVERFELDGQGKASVRDRHGDVVWWTQWF